MKINYETDYDVGQDNVQVMGMDMHNPVFFISALLILTFVIGTLIFPEQANALLNGSKGWVIEHFDWLFMVSGNVFVLFCVMLAVLPLGKMPSRNSLLCPGLPCCSQQGWALA
jgi:BCCT family betaine/carnitine transporter